MGLRFQTMSVVAGTHICNASCPFCVSKMTGMRNIASTPEPINELNLGKAIRLAELSGVTSVLITGKGEPTLYPEHIDAYLAKLSDFPFIELQTNGWVFGQDTYRNLDTFHMLEGWQKAGLTTVLLSNCGPDEELNRSIYFPTATSWRPAFEDAITKVHDADLMVRLTTVGIKGGVDTPAKLDDLMRWARSMEVEQVSWRPVNKPSDVEPDWATVADWVQSNGLSDDEVRAIRDHVDEIGTMVYPLVHGSAVYDYRGQNLCLANCLTRDADHPDDDMRQLIFFPDGTLYTSWDLPGSRLL